MWKAGNVINRIGRNPPAVLIWDDETGADVGEARTIEAARIMAAAPAMLAALQKVQAYAMAAPWLVADGTAEAVSAAIAAATGSPAPVQSPPVESDGKRTDTWNLVPGAQPEEDEGDDLGKVTYTALCQQLDGRGTIWVSEVEGNTHETAIQAAREACAFDWGCDFQDVHCLGLIAGNAAVVHWEDLLSG